MKTYWLLGKLDPDAGYGHGGQLQPMCPFTAGLGIQDSGAPSKGMSLEDRMSILSEDASALPENEKLRDLDTEGNTHARLGGKKVF